MEQIHEITPSKIDIAELRVDLFSSFNADDALEEVKKFHEVPSLLTIRSEAERGGWNQSEQERLSLFKTLIPEVDAVDIEYYSTEIIDNILLEADKHHLLKIISYHNFDETPKLSELETIRAQAKQKGADIVKIAVKVLTHSDLRTLAQLLVNNPDENLVVIGMGDIGLVSRVFFPALGSLITFAYLSDSSAPGQLHLNQMSELFDLFYPS